MRTLFVIAALSVFAGCATTAQKVPLYSVEEYELATAPHAPSELEARIAELNERRNESTDANEQARLQLELRELTARRDVEVRRDTAIDDGSGGGFPSLPPLQLVVFGQSTGPSFGAGVDGVFKSITLTATTTPVRLPQNGSVCFNSPTCTAQIAAGSSALSFFNPAGTEVLDLLSTSSEARITGILTVSSASTKGTKTLVAGSATQTVLSGVQCVCSNTSTATVCKASVSGTTATFVSGAGTDVVSYICL